jgi:hypothetical protein
MVALHNAGTYRLTGIDKRHLLFYGGVSCRGTRGAQEHEITR